LNAGRFFFETGISAFGTGAMSWKDNGEIAWIPGASCCGGLLAARVVELELPETDEANIHAVFHENNPAGVVVSAFTPETETAARLALANGGTPRRTLVPIDAEGAILEGRVSVFAPDAGTRNIVETLSENGLVVIAGGGAYAAGDTVWSALRRLSGLKDISHYIISSASRGLDIATLAARLDSVRLPVKNESGQ